MPTIRTITIQANLVWYARQASHNRWIGVCDALNIATEACSEEELRSLIPESIDLLMRDLLTDNELQQYLEEKGWSADQPVPKSGDDVSFQIPWNLTTDNNGDQQRSAN